MQITIITIGTRGDVQPFVALGLGLKQAGHAVTLVSTLDYADFVNSYGLKFWPIHIDFRDWMQSAAGRAVMNPGYNMIHSLRQLQHVAQSIVDRCLVDVWAACQEAEAVIYGAVAVFLTMAHIQPLLGIPCLRVKMQPGLHPTSHFPPPTVPPLSPPLPADSWPVKAYNRLTHLALDQIFWQPLRAQVNNWRQTALGLPPLPWHGPYQIYQCQQLPTLQAYSPRFVTRPDDWPTRCHITGFWFLNAPPDWQPPLDLLNFLAAGPPPLVVSFGSTLFQEGNTATETILRAIAATRQRAIFLSGWGGLNRADLPDHIYATQSIPYDWLLPQVKAVIHHGGAGTMAAALRAGIPSITIPVFADHPFWARRLAALGLGTPPIPHSRLTVVRLAEAIRAVTEDETISANTRRFQPIIEAENGVQHAVEIIEHYLADPVVGPFRVGQLSGVA